MIKRIDQADRREHLYWLCRGMLHVALRIYCRLSIRGAHHVPAQGPCVIASNHTSFLDPPVVGGGIGHRVVRFMARDTLFRGFFGWWLRHVGVIPLSREKGDVAALRKAIEMLKAGNCLGLFPEGTRSPDGRLQAAKGGIGFILSKAGVPVVPALVRGTFAAYPKGARIIRPCKVSVVYGAPITPEEIRACGSGREAYDEVGRLVMARIAALQEPAPQTST